MPAKYDAFSIEIPIDDEEMMKVFQEAMTEHQADYMKHIQEVAKKLEISEDAASDVVYLRTRSRWSEETEKELIRLHKAGNPPNIMEWP